MARKIQYIVTGGINFPEQLFDTEQEAIDWALARPEGIACFIQKVVYGQELIDEKKDEASKDPRDVSADDKK